MTDLYRIKPLVWDDSHNGIYSRADRYSVCVMSAVDRSFGAWHGGDSEGPGAYFGTFDTLEAAKSACESHRLARLMEHLEPVNQETTP